MTVSRLVLEYDGAGFAGWASQPGQRTVQSEVERALGLKISWMVPNDFKTAIDPILFQSVVRPMGAHAEAWIAAYRMTPEGRGFPGVTPALRSVLGATSAQAA